MSIATLKTGESQGEFDPYLKWLGIEPREHAPGKPPNHYRLLGINAYTSDPDVISNAADRQMAHVRNFQIGSHGDASQQILNAIAAAKLCLLDPAKKAVYDATLASSATAVTALTIGPQVGAILRVEDNGQAGQRVDVGIAAAPQARTVQRPSPRQHSTNGNGTHTPIPIVPTATQPTIVPPKAPPPMLVVVDPGSQAPPPQQEWGFVPPTSQSSIDAYKRKNQEQTWLQKNMATVGATVGGVALAGAAGLYAIFGGSGKPAESVGNRPVAKKIDDVKTPKPPVFPIERPKIDTPTPAAYKPMQEDPSPPQIAVNSVPQVRIDPVEEARKKAEEEKRKAEEAQKKFEAEVERTTSEYRVKFAKVPTDNMRQLAEQHPEASVSRRALLKLTEEKIAHETQCAQFQAEVEATYRTFIAPDSPYKNVSVAQLQTASQTEKDPVVRAALCVLLAMQSGSTGNAYQLHSALSDIRDSRFPGQKILAMETKILESHTGVPNKDMPPKSRLEMGRLALREVRTAMTFDDYELAERLCNAADEYAKANSSIASIRDARERAALTEQARQLRWEVNLGKQGAAQRKAMYASHMAGLDLTMEPKDPQASARTGTFLIVAHADWIQGMKYLQHGDNPLLAEAARLDLSVPSKSNVEAQYNAAMAWKAAADGNAGGNSAVWYARAAHWLLKAEQGKPTGKLKLDLQLVRGDLEGRGVLARESSPTRTQEPDQAEKKWTPVDLNKLAGKGFASRNGKPVLTTYWAPVNTEVVPNKSYEMEFKAEIKGDDYFAVHLPIGASSTWVILNDAKVRHSISQVRKNGSMTTISTEEDTTNEISPGKEVIVLLGVNYSTQNRELFATVTVDINGSRVLEHTAPAQSFAPEQAEGWKAARGIAFMQHKETSETTLSSMRYRDIP